ncbi:IS3 family transposase, partial [Lysobacteraceae bacterium NML07-0707]
MAKYSEAFKLGVVQSYASGESGFRAIAQRYGLDHATVRRWVKAYQAHGVQGLRRKFSRYSADFKLSVLQRIAQEGLSVREAMALSNIRGSTRIISGWQRQYHAQGLAGLQPKPRGRPKKMSMSQSPKPVNALPDAQRSREALLEEVRYLRAEVAYLKNCRPCVRPKPKLRRKSAGSACTEARPHIGTPV